VEGAKAAPDPRNGDVRMPMANIWVAFHGRRQDPEGRLQGRPPDDDLYSPNSQTLAGTESQETSRTTSSWFAEIWVDKLAAISISRQQTFVEYPMPNAETDMRTLQVDPRNPNRVWYVGMNSNRIGYLEVVN